MKLLLVKHSMSNHNPNQPAAKWGLTAEGIQRCKALATHLGSYKPEQLFSSTMPKALDTARLVALELDDIPIVDKVELQEHSRKSNAPYFDSADEFNVAIKRMLENPDELHFGDETAHHAQQRFSQGIHTCLQAASADEHVVVVAHGTVNTLFTAQHNDIDIYNLWSRLKLPSIIVLDLPSFKLESVIEDAGIPVKA